MFSFCPHCGQTIGGKDQVERQILVCRECGKPIGMVTAPKKVMVDEADDLIRRGTAARCQICTQVVEIKTGGTFVPHYALGQKKICPGSGKPVQSPEPSVRPAGGRDLHALMTREVIKVVLCKRNAEPSIEELTLETLDKSDRVRLQIEALREILGPGFRMKPYPQVLGKADLAIWGNATAFVVAKKNEHGGYQQMTAGELTAVLHDIRQSGSVFTFGE